MSARRIDVDLDRLCGFVNERQDPGDDVTRELVGDLAEHHDLAPFEQARFELVDEPFGWLPVAVVRRIGIFRRFIGIAEDGRVVAQSRILFGFNDRLGNSHDIGAQYPTLTATATSAPGYRSPVDHYRRWSTARRR